MLVACCNLMQLSIYCVLSARHDSGLYAHLQEQWMLQFLYICCICKEIVTSIAPEDGRISPKHVELKEHK